MATKKKTAAWSRKEGKNQKGGLNEVGRKSYERESAMCKLSKDILCISGCRDDQYSADSSDATGNPAGALSSSIMEVLNQNHKDLTWSELLTMVRFALKKGDYDQIPQLSMGKKGLEKNVVDI